MFTAPTDPTVVPCERDEIDSGGHLTETPGTREVDEVCAVVELRTSPVATTSPEGDGFDVIVRSPDEKDDGARVGAGAGAGPPLDPEAGKGDRADTGVGADTDPEDAPGAGGNPLPTAGDGASVHNP